MKIETILDAYALSSSLAFDETLKCPKDERQWLAFRDRILFDFATREAVIELCQQRLREKDAEIDFLKAIIVRLKDRPSIDPGSWNEVMGDHYD